jgi:hypothetical protein
LLAVAEPRSEALRDSTAAVPEPAVCLLPGLAACAGCEHGAAVGERKRDCQVAGNRLFPLPVKKSRLIDSRDSFRLAIWFGL